MEKVAKKVRQSNIELLRIFAIIIIIINHMALHTPWRVVKSVNDARLVTQWLGTGGRLGVNIFILISGYFLVKSTFKWRSLSKLWVQVWLYAVGIFFIFHHFTQLGQTISLNQLRISFLPIMFNQWWFITAYIIMYLFVPFMNKFAQALSQKEYRNFLLLFLVVGSVWPTIAPKISIYSDVVWMMFVYMIGGYIRLYPDFIKNLKTKTLVGLWAGVAALMLGSIQFMNWFNSLDANKFISMVRAIGISNTRFANAPMNPLSLILAVIIFAVFLRLPIPGNKLINGLAANVFGIYLLQSSSIGHKWLWDLVDAQRFTNGWKILIYSIAVGLVIFAVGSVIVALTNLITNPLEKLTFGKLDTYLKKRKLAKVSQATETK